MGRIYTVEFENIAVSAAQDFFEVAPADDKPCKLLALFLSQSSDFGDAAEEGLRLRIIRGHATTGSGGATPTARPVSPSDVAAGFVAKTNNTTIASAGTATNLWSHAFNIRVGMELWFPEKCEFECSQANGVLIVVRLMAAPADALSMSGTIFVEEAG